MLLSASPVVRLEDPKTFCPQVDAVSIYPSNTSELVYLFLYMYYAFFLLVFVKKC